MFRQMIRDFCIEIISIHIILYNCLHEIIIIIIFIIIITLFACFLSILMCFSSSAYL
jgi:hypothetical protein